MKKHLILINLIFFLAVLSGLSAQTSSGAGYPSVSQLRAETKNNLIKLTWVDAPNAKGPVYIFRSARSFGKSLPLNFRPVVIQYGTQYYVDDSEDIENLHYFVAASDINGQRFDNIITQANSISVSMTEEPVVEANAAREGSLAADDSQGEPLSGEGISNIVTRQSGEGVVITFTVGDESKNVILFRSAQPIRQPRDLISAVIVQSGVNSPSMDFPVLGTPWYYAVVYENEIANGNVTVKQGVNAAASAVVISGDGSPVWEVKKDEELFRPIPLPQLTLNNYSAGRERQGSPEQIPLSAETIKMLERTKVQKVPLAQKNPRVFSEDLRNPSSGEESALVQIVQEYFTKRDWENARLHLQNYLSLPRPEDVQSRARFYLGQTWYFTGNYREALFEFLPIQSFHPEINVWINTILEAMVH